MNCVAVGRRIRRTFLARCSAAENDPSLVSHFSQIVCYLSRLRFNLVCHQRFPPLSGRLAPPLLLSSVFFLRSSSLMSVVCFNEFVVDTSPAPSSVCHSSTLPAGLKPEECKHTQNHGAAAQTHPQCNTVFFLTYTYGGDRKRTGGCHLHRGRAGQASSGINARTKTSPLHTRSYTSMYTEARLFCGALEGCSCPNALIIPISSLLINDPSVPPD